MERSSGEHFCACVIHRGSSQIMSAKIGALYLVSLLCIYIWYGNFDATEQESWQNNVEHEQSFASIRQDKFVKTKLDHLDNSENLGKLKLSLSLFVIINPSTQSRYFLIIHDNLSR